MRRERRRGEMRERKEGRAEEGESVGVAEVAKRDHLLAALVCLAPQ